MGAFKKMFNILIIILIIMFLFNNISYATVVGTIEGKIKNNVATTDSGKTIKNLINAVLEIIKIIGAAVAAAILIIIATKYMLGAAGERAEIKKYAVTYVIGAIVFFGATKIVDILIKFAQG